MFKKFEILLRSYSNRLTLRFPKIFGREYLKDVNIRVLLTLTGLLVLVTWLVAVFRFQPNYYMVPTRYNSFLGVTTLGYWYDLYYIPGIMTLCVAINTYLASVVFRVDKMVSYILLGANIFVSVFAMIAVINLSRLVNV